MELKETESPAGSPESEDIETSCSEQVLSEERFGKPQESYSRVRRNRLSSSVLYDSPIFRHMGELSVLRRVPRGVLWKNSLMIPKCTCSHDWEFGWLVRDCMQSSSSKYLFSAGSSICIGLYLAPFCSSFTGSVRGCLERYCCQLLFCISGKLFIFVSPSLSPPQPPAKKKNLWSRKTWWRVEFPLGESCHQRMAEHWRSFPSSHPSLSASRVLLLSYRHCRRSSKMQTAEK